MPKNGYTGRWRGIGWHLGVDPWAFEQLLLFLFLFLFLFFFVFFLHAYDFRNLGIDSGSMYGGRHGIERAIYVRDGHFDAIASL